MIETLMLSLKVIAFLCLDVLTVAITGILVLLLAQATRSTLKDLRDED